MHVPVGSHFVSTIKGRAERPVLCGKCGATYVYIVARISRGVGTSFLWLDNDGAKARAQQRALDRLPAILEHAIDPIACPRCGWYQPAMVKVARRRRGEWLVVPFLAATVIAVLVALLLICGPDGDARASAVQRKWLGVFGSVAVACAVVRFFVCTIWDPNADGAWKRRRQAKDAGRAMMRDEFDRIAAESARQRQPPTSPSPPDTGGSPDRA